MCLFMAQQPGFNFNVRIGYRSRGIHKSCTLRKGILLSFRLPCLTKHRVVRGRAVRVVYLESLATYRCVRIPLGTLDSFMSASFQNAGGSTQVPAHASEIMH